MQESSCSSLNSHRSKSSSSKSDDYVYANASIIDDMAIEIDDHLLNKGGFIQSMELGCPFGFTSERTIINTRGNLPKIDEQNESQAESVQMNTSM